MAGEESSPAEFKRRLPAPEREAVDRHLAAGHGLARYDDARGRPLVVISWGGGRDTT